jgi:hypothetical protein
MASVLLAIFFFIPSPEYIFDSETVKFSKKYVDNKVTLANKPSTNKEIDNSSTINNEIEKTVEHTSKSESTGTKSYTESVTPDTIASIDINIDNGNETVLIRPINKYSYPPVSFDQINLDARNALVNIICTTGVKSLTPISASGIIIDQRGVILTNAHVGQYFLLERDPKIDIDCNIRTGSPAKAKYKGELLYIPSSWIKDHAHQISESMPTGTGEHDWAILRITKTIGGSNLPSIFPYVSFDSREAAGFTDDAVLLASYPAGFVGGSTVLFNLFSASTITNIKKLYTFDTGSVDLLSLGGVIVAQGGSSGGAVMNAWNQLIGIIVTSSEAETTSDRDLRAITMSHVNTSIQKHLGTSLYDFLLEDISEIAENFQNNVAPELTEQLVKAIK